VLAAAVVRDAVERAGIHPREVGHVVFGNVIHTDIHDMYLARVAAINGGLPVETPAFTLNRLCGSGLQAIVSAAQVIMLGDADAAVAGGAEGMSRGQYWLPGLRWGQRMNDAAVVDAMVGALTDPFDDCHMGLTAENLAARYDISRHDQDALAVESQQRASAALAQGYFTEQRPFRKSREALPAVGKDAFGGTNEVGTAGLMGSQSDDDRRGVGEGDMLGHGGPADDGRARQPQPAGGDSRHGHLLGFDVAVRLQRADDTRLQQRARDSRRARHATHRLQR